MRIDEIKNKPLISAGEAIANGFSIVKNNFSVVMFIMLVIYFPINLLSGYVTLEVGNLGASVDLPTILADPELIKEFIQTPQYMKMLLFNNLGTIIELVLAPFGAMSMIYITKTALEEKAVEQKDALNAAFSNAGRFFLSTIVFVLCIGFLTLLGLIPGILLYMIWYFYLQAIVLNERCSGIRSLGYSREVVKGRWWRTFLFMVVFYMFEYVLRYVVVSIFMWDSYFSIVISGIIMSFVRMLVASAQTVVYINFEANPVNKNRQNTKAIK